MILLLMKQSITKTKENYVFNDYFINQEAFYESLERIIFIPFSKQTKIYLNILLEVV